MKIREQREAVFSLYLGTVCKGGPRGGGTGAGVQSQRLLAGRQAWEPLALHPPPGSLYAAGVVRVCPQEGRAAP